MPEEWFWAWTEYTLHHAADCAGMHTSVLLMVASCMARASPSFHPILRPYTGGQLRRGQLRRGHVLPVLAGQPGGEAQGVRGGKKGGGKAGEGGQATQGPQAEGGEVGLGIS